MYRVLGMYRPILFLKQRRMFYKSSHIDLYIRHIPDDRENIKG